MQTHLYTGGPAPPEYVEMKLCRDIYHCTPIELEEVPLPKVIAHLICYNEEQKWLTDKYR